MDPTSLEQWKKQMTVFQNSLLMCMAVFPQFSQFNAAKKDFDDMYEFILGPRLATRTPAPSVKVMMITERKMWKEIALLMHKGSHLK